MRLRKNHLLNRLDLGSDVAESDEHLREYFVRTNVFNEVIHDETDLILGPKGSGKTAIFRMLADTQFPIDALADTYVVPAFNVQGEVVFHQLSDDGKWNEQVLRRLWTAYILAIVGRTIVEECQPSSYASEIKKRLSEFDLWPSETTARGTWTRLLTSVTKLSAKVSSGLGGPGGEAVLEFSTGADPASSPGWLTQAFDSETLTRLFIEALDGDNSRCWIIFDRLDEAFDNPALERSALRALMRAQADLSSYSPAIRVKLFLRSDVFSRVTRDAGFVNLTHFRVLRIQWNRRQIKDLVIQRLADSEEFLTLMHERRITTRDSALKSFFSGVTEGEGSRRRTVDPMAYMLEKTVDAHAEFNPRNVVSFIRAARRYELANSQKSDHVLARDEPVISQEAMVRAWHRVSEQRVTDTLYAEFNAMRGLIERFRNCPQRFDSEYLATVLGLDNDETALKEAISDLEDCGFISLSGRSIYKVPDLYRPYLGLNPKWEDRGARQAAEREAWRRSRRTSTSDERRSGKR